MSISKFGAVFIKKTKNKFNINHIELCDLINKQKEEIKKILSILNEHEDQFKKKLISISTQIQSEYETLLQATVKPIDGKLNVLTQYEQQINQFEQLQTKLEKYELAINEKLLRLSATQSEQNEKLNKTISRLEAKLTKLELITQSSVKPLQDELQSVKLIQNQQKQSFDKHLSELNAQFERKSKDLQKTFEELKTNCVTFSVANKETLCNMRGRRIVNCALAKTLDDVITKRYLENNNKKLQQYYTMVINELKEQIDEKIRLLIRQPSDNVIIKERGKDE